jgi:head-tail adaptor
MSIEALFDRTVSIERQGSKVSDGMGGFISGPPIVVPNVPVRISPLSARDRVLYQQYQYPVTHKVFAPGEAGVSPGEALILDDGRRLLVHGVLNPSEAGHHLELLCEEIVKA